MKQDYRVAIQIRFAVMEVWAIFVSLAPCGRLLPITNIEHSSSLSTATSLFVSHRPFCSLILMFPVDVNVVVLVVHLLFSLWLLVAREILVPRGRKRIHQAPHLQLLGAGSHHTGPWGEESCWGKCFWLFSRNVFLSVCNYASTGSASSSKPFPALTGQALVGDLASVPLALCFVARRTPLSRRA